MTWLQCILDLPKRWRLRKRAVFRYYDGKRARYGDPFGIARALQNDKEVNLAEAIEDSQKAEEPGTSQLIDLIARVFSVARWNGSNGLTDNELIRLFDSFDDFILEVKKNSASGQTSPQPTEPVPSA